MIRSIHLIRILGLVAAVALLCGCNALKLGYNSLDQVAYWWLNRYVDFEGEQKQRVREDLANLQQWHRRQELPEFVSLLRQAEQLAPGELTSDQVCALVPGIRHRLEVLAEQAEPAAVKLALNLSGEQLAHLEGKYQGNNRDYRKDWLQLPPDEQKEKRFKQYLDRLERVYGRLAKPQRDILRNRMDQSVFDAAINLRERQRRQQEILQALRKLAAQPVPPEEARSVVRNLMERGLHSPDPAYRAYQEALTREGCQNLAAVHNSTTPQQREHAVRRLRGYQRDLEELSAQH